MRLWRSGIGRSVIDVQANLGLDHAPTKPQKQPLAMLDFVCLARLMAPLRSPYEDPQRAPLIVPPKAPLSVTFDTLSDPLALKCFSPGSSWAPKETADGHRGP